MEGAFHFAGDRRSGVVEKALQGEVMSQRVPPNAGRWFCSSLLIVIPAKAGIHLFCLCFLFAD